ncbi:TetR/AcrR family transcriptional regulator [Saccharospirillum salsuginis]|uniref:TetR family transcriptional regulator n=1 Tax=Saccharospirillum salsuginis TaxID=418750 RepID=A0A918KMR2_9GAMM|nr:TetR/AcrR family transcriptional regulator [Saccharospirillum salsuginis]GGX67654.1 TetR family transcriptional regulator [Saccharospirillum salsuginis]
MPKIVDHDQYRRELAQKAVALFSEHGYRGLGMRRIAEELGLSKSALYHYFPSKEALFAACTDEVTRFEPSGTEDGALADLMRTFESLEPGMVGELSLLLDYLRGKSPTEVAEDPTMRLANRRYRERVAAAVGEANATPVLCLLLGTLLQRWLDGGTTSFDEIERWLNEHLVEK